MDGASSVTVTSCLFTGNVAVSPCQSPRYSYMYLLLVSDILSLNA